MSHMFGTSPGNALAIDPYTSTEQRFSFNSITLATAGPFPLMQPGRKAELIIVTARSVNTTNVNLWNESVANNAGVGFTIAPGGSQLISVDNIAWDVCDALCSVFKQAFPQQTFRNTRSRNELDASAWFVTTSAATQFVDICVGYGPHQ
jgi:hypothetical protein